MIIIYSFQAQYLEHNIDNELLKNNNINQANNKLVTVNCLFQILHLGYYIKYIHRCILKYI
jgi:hypothetical protein